MGEITCPICGKENPFPGSDECEHCGVNMFEDGKPQEATQQETKLPPKPRPATKKQLVYIKGIDLPHSDNITFDEATTLLNTWESIRYYVLDIWDMIFKKNFWNSGIPREELDGLLRSLHKKPNLVEKIIKIENKRYNEACEQANADKEKVSRDNKGRFTKGYNYGEDKRPFKEYFSPILKDDIFKYIKILLEANFKA